MTLVERADRFILGGTTDDTLVPLLAHCVMAHDSNGLSAVKRLAGDMYGGFTYNWELKAPAACCLLSWGHDGMRVLIDNAHEDPSSKNMSLALQILASTAAGNVLRLIQQWVRDPILTDAIVEACGDLVRLAPMARQRLHEFVFSFKTETMHHFTSLMR